MLLLDLEMTASTMPPLAGDCHITWSMPSIGIPSSSNLATPSS